MTKQLDLKVHDESQHTKVVCRNIHLHDALDEARRYDKSDPIECVYSMNTERCLTPPALHREDIAKY